AGLFSAVVTAFTVESYRWLSEDPADTTVAILIQIAGQLNGQNATTVNEKPSFAPSSSVVRINTFWFLSLILSLVDALLGLMFKQWLREYRRPTNTQTPEQWLSLRCFRSESLERWHVPSFLATLPIILELALFLFFAGLLELLWTRHPVPFAFAMAIIGSAVSFYIATTLIPGIDLIRLAFYIHPEVQGEPSVHSYWYGERWKNTLSNLPRIHYLCPYKSPQAWATFRLLVWLVTSPFPIGRKVASYHLKRRFYRDGQSFDVSWVIKRISNIGSWSSADLEIVQRFSKVEKCPDMYALKAYRWLVQESRDSPAMIPHLQTVLKEVPAHLVMPTIFDSEIVRVDRDWNADDVERALRTGPRPWDWEFEYSDVNIRLLFFHNMWIQHHDLWLSSLASIFNSEMVYHRSWYGRRAPLTRILQLMAGSADEQGLASEGYMNDIMANNRIGSEKDWSDIIRCIPPSLEALATIPLDIPSHRTLLYQFLLWIRKEVVQKFDYHTLTPFTETYTLIDAFDTFRIAHDLPMNYFESIPGYFPISMDRLGLLLRDSSASTVTIGRELLEEYKRVWDTHRTLDKWKTHLLLSYLTEYILIGISYDRCEGRDVQNVTIPEWIEGLFENSKTDIPYILTCEEGLSLLRYSELSTEWAGYDSDRLGAWRLALKCVAQVNKLPLDYFTSPENRDP
ncbi:hypothetical protein V5O48_012978, partial [Marasmius crinis-equi]